MVLSYIASILGKKNVAKIKSLLARRPNKSEAKKIDEFKSTFWTQDSGAEAFEKGADPKNNGISGWMDDIINDTFLSYCEPENKVLEIGSGHGIVSRFLASKGLNIVACDVSEPLLASLDKYAKHEGLEIETRQGDAFSIPASDGEFDVVVSRMFLSHFPNWQTVLKDCGRCVKKGGKLLMHFTSKENVKIGQKYGKHECRNLTSDKTNDPFGYMVEATEGEIDAFCSKHNFEKIARIPIMPWSHNRIIGYALGTKDNAAFHQELGEKLQNQEVRDFVVWLDKTLHSKMPVWYSFSNILVLEKK